MTHEKTPGAEVEVRIYSIATSLTESIIFLDETEGTRILPIWIGPMEAQAIAIRLSGYPSPRPMTHDLIFSVIKTLGLTVRRTGAGRRSSACRNSSTRRTSASRSTLSTSPSPSPFPVR